MTVRRLKDDAVLDHPVRTFLCGLVGTVNGADKALADFDRMARRALDMELLLLKHRELAGESERVLGDGPARKA